MYRIQQQKKTPILYYVSITQQKIKSCLYHLIHIPQCLMCLRLLVRGGGQNYGADGRGESFVYKTAHVNSRGARNRPMGQTRVSHYSYSLLCLLFPDWIWRERGAVRGKMYSLVRTKNSTISV